MGACGLPASGDIERSVDGFRRGIVGKAFGSVAEIGDFAAYGFDLGNGFVDDSGVDADEASRPQAWFLCRLWYGCVGGSFGDAGGFVCEF